MGSFGFMKLNIEIKRVLKLYCCAKCCAEPPAVESKGQITRPLHKIMHKVTLGMKPEQNKAEMLQVCGR